jgi:predicted O-methyltransferase YrrM
MKEQLRKLAWYAYHPRFWPHAAALAARTLMPKRESPEIALAARQWAAENAVSVPEALARVGLLSSSDSVPRLSQLLLADGGKRAEGVPVHMGGSGDTCLIFAAARLSGARHVVETGVGFGWSSLALLAALEGKAGASLFSVDMPYPNRGNEPYVGIVVPDFLRSNWTLIREPDRRGLGKALRGIGGSIDLCHYDSDKSWWGRMYAYPLLWNALRPGGVFISDDIQDNSAFKEFVERVDASFAVTKFQEKFAGILRKGSGTPGPGDRTPG